MYEDPPQNLGIRSCLSKMYLLREYKKHFSFCLLRCNHHQNQYTYGYNIDKYYITSRSLENICTYNIRKCIQHNFKRDYLDHIYDFVETVKPLQKINTYVFIKKIHYFSIAFQNRINLNTAAYLNTRIVHSKNAAENTNHCSFL